MKTKTKPAPTHCVRNPGSGGRMWTGSRMGGILVKTGHLPPALNPKLWQGQRPTRERAALFQSQARSPFSKSSKLGLSFCHPQLVKSLGCGRGQMNSDGWIRLTSKWMKEAEFRACAISLRWMQALPVGEFSRV